MYGMVVGRLGNEVELAVCIKICKCMSGGEREVYCVIDERIVMM